ncbi:MAG: DUF4361 domain-containing protein [Bacteroidales bacterium]|nr:DUF4361 domain-containing protein [Bacteroidales bacterium]
MNRYIQFVTAVMLVCGTVSCNRNEVFEQEQYKNVFALVSGTDNVSEWFHDLRKAESVGYVSASLGGSNPSTKEIRVALVEDTKLIDAYNSTAYDANTSRYIRPLSRDKYTIDTYDFTIPTGDVKASIPVSIRPGGLSPDSSYFIALKVDTYSAYEVNPEKDFVLYRIRTKNWWCVQGGSAYTQRGDRVQSGTGGNPMQVFGSKRLYPLTERTVRVLAGTELNDDSKAEIFRKRSMILTIGDDNKITIRPLSNSLVINQVDGDEEFSNVVLLNNDRFKYYKTFLLCYTYEHSDGVTYLMREELRTEYVPDSQDPRFLNQ